MGAVRITPACAGKTYLFQRGSETERDHPPRVRGKLRLYSCLENHLRITPACAGKTFRIYLLIFLTQDHPRVCGEN